MLIIPKDKWQNRADIIKMTGQKKIIHGYLPYCDKGILMGKAKHLRCARQLANYSAEQKARACWLLYYVFW